MSSIKLYGPRHAQLLSLARNINAREDTILSSRKKVEDSTAAFATEVLLQGQDLLKAKQAVKHGEWLEWLQIHCPLISERSANVYMRLASNPQRAADLLRSGSIRQALASGEEEKPKPPGETRSWPPYIEALGRVSKFVGYVERFPIPKWPDEGREKLRAELLPVVQALWPEKF